jgi:hypothetical protein
MSEDNKEEKQESKDEAKVEEFKNSAPSSKTASAAKKMNMKPVIGVIGGLVLLFAVLHFAGVIDLSETTTQDSDTEIPQATGVVARVNGEDIMRAELDERLEQIRNSIPEGSPDPTQDAAFSLQMLDELINIKLLELLALDAGYTVSDDEIQAEVDAVAELFGGEEQLATELSTVGLSDEEFRENVANELLIRQLIDDNTTIDEIEISDEQIQEAYNQAFAGQEDAPVIEEVSGFIEEQLRQQETSAEVQAFIETKRSEANVEILL